MCIVRNKAGNLISYLIYFFGFISLGMTYLIIFHFLFINE